MNTKTLGFNMPKTNSFVLLFVFFKIIIMNITVNTRLLLKGKMDGIGWFTYHSLKHITTKYSEHNFFFIFDRPFDNEFIFSKNITPIVVSPQTRHPFLWYLWFEHRIPSVLKKTNSDVFLSPDGYLSLNTNIPSLPVIHDINFVHRPEDLPFLARKYYNSYFPKFANKAGRIATVSEYSKADISKQYNIPAHKIDVVYNGLSSVYKPINVNEQKNTKELYTFGKDYFIFVGSLHPRKNIARLFLAYDIFKQETKSEIKLVIVGGKMFKTSELTDVFNKMEFKKDVIFTGRVEPDALHHLIASAFAMTFVPTFEGFGIPIIEAMGCDIPVLCSNTTSMPEVGGDAVSYIDPFSVNSIKNGMLKLFNDKALRINLIEKAKIQRTKFSWEQTGEKLWESINNLLEN